MINKKFKSRNLARSVEFIVKISRHSTGMNIIYFEHLVLSILAINREQSSVSISPLLKTVWRSLYNILYFAVLLNLCLMDIYSTSQYFPLITYLYTSRVCANQLLHPFFLQRFIKVSVPNSPFKNLRLFEGLLLLRFW